MKPFDAIRHRADRRAAAATYAERLAYLDHTSSIAETSAAQDAAAAAAGEWLTDRDRARVDDELLTRLSLQAAEAYGDELVALPLDAVLDGSWIERLSELNDRWSQWLRDEHREDQHWQAGEAVMHAALEAGRVDDGSIAAIEAFLTAVDPDGPTTLDDPWFPRFAAARLATGLLPRPRHASRLITQEGETIVLSEPGAHVERVEWVDGQDRLRERDEVTPVQIEASDRRLAVFGDELILSVLWTDVVGASAGEDEHGTFLRIDDAANDVTHVVHSPVAGLLVTMARELHRRTGA